jgi:flagellin-specific chaperone FliS
MSDSHLATHDDAGSAEPYSCLVDASNMVLELIRDLDFKRGGDVAPRLASLYGYVAGELLNVNTQARNRPDRVLKA